MGALVDSPQSLTGWTEGKPLTHNSKTIEALIGSSVHNLTPPDARQHVFRPQPKIAELESIRGLAALLILIAHIPHWNPSFIIRLIENGHLMVELFFVLSGFVIYSTYSTRISSHKDLIRFQFLRFGRLYPVHLLFLITFLLIEFAKYYAQTRHGILSKNSYPFRENSPTAFLQQLFLIHAIGPTGNTTTFNSPAWSISVEFFTYLLFGLVVLIFPKSTKHIFSTLFAGSLLLLVSKNTFGFDALIRCYAGFFLGCMVAYTKEKSDISLPNYTSILAFAATLAFLMLNAMIEYDFLIYFLTAILIFTIISSKSGILNRFLTLKPFTWLGTISYSLYMSHQAIEWTANQIIRIAFTKPEVLIEGRSTPALSGVEAAIAYLLTIATVLAVSSIVYILVEKPLREKSRRFAVQRLS